jgi:hypothetical protein
MLITPQLRWLVREVHNGALETGSKVFTERILQQWYDPELTRGELAGEWRDVPEVVSEAVSR